jgi:hypothetical protein
MYRAALRRRTPGRGKSTNVLTTAVLRVTCLLGTKTSDTRTTVGMVVLAIAIVTLVFFSAIRRHDVELSFDQLSAFERHVHTFGNKTVYVVSPNKPDLVLATLPHDDWTKVSSKIDFVAFVYDEAFSLSGNSIEPSSSSSLAIGDSAGHSVFNERSHEAILRSGGSGISSKGLTGGSDGEEALDGMSNVWAGSNLITRLQRALEMMEPHGYGIALFGCGCIVHNILLQHVSTRFDGFECALLPGFIMEPAAVRWVDGGSGGDGCIRGRNVLLSSPWYEQNSRRLEAARHDFAGAKQRLRRMQHPDRPGLPRN